MKKILTAFALFMGLAMISFAQADKTKPADATAAEGGPIMELETMEVDYGVIEQNSEPYRVFKFTNTGDEPLQITNAKGSCGCTVPEYPKEPIFPGESSEIKVRYDTKRIGKFAKRVTLTTNEAVSTKTLTIKGEVLKPAPEPAGLPEEAPSILGGSGK